MPKGGKEDSNDWVVPEEADLHSVWKQVAFIGTELKVLPLIDAEPWFFPHLDEELENGILSEGKPVWIFGGSEGMPLQSNLFLAFFILVIL